MPTVYDKNRNKISLKDKHFIASGGQGSVYAKSKVAYKIYTKSDGMIPVAKINELSVLKLPNIIAPKEVIYDKKRKPIGYTMAHVTDSEALCRMFAKSFKDRNNISPDMTLDLVQEIQSGLQHIHSHNGILAVDINEMNFLVDRSFKIPYFIDVDSYQTKSFHATAIMESVRDRHMTAHDFNHNTDWFSWGIVTFQLFIGIHPYKGKHASIKGLDDRMQQNISVFNPSVSYPKVCLPFDVIPSAYRDWYKAVFEDGKRCPPPSGPMAKILLVTQVKHIKGSDNFEIKELQQYDSDIIDYIHYDGTTVVVTKNRIHVNNKANDKPSADTHIAHTDDWNSVVSAWIDDGKLKVRDLSMQRDVEDDINAEKIMSYDGRLYIQSGTSVYEIKFMDMQKATRAFIHPVANVMPMATRFYDGVIFQSLLSSCYVSIFPEQGMHYQVHIKELEDHRIIDARYDNHVLMVLASKKGQYDRFVFRFNDNYDSYDVQMSEDVDTGGMDFVVLDSGICVHMDDEENINLFTNKESHAKGKVIDDPSIDGDMLLFRHAGRIVVAKDDKLYSMKMK